MRRKTTIAAIVISATLISIVGMQFFEKVYANPTYQAPPPKIFIISPEPRLYNENHITLSLCGQLVTWGTIEYSNVKFWLDNKLQGTLDKLTSVRESDAYSVSFEGLSDGNHFIQITATLTVISVIHSRIVIPWQNPMEISKQVEFTVDTTSPDLSILTPSKTFKTSNVSINFTTSELVTKLYYALDDNSTMTYAKDVIMARIYGKDNYYLTLNSVADGTHNLKIYAQDAAGQIGESDTYYFTVNLQPTPSPSPITSPSPTQEPTLKPTFTPNPAPSSENNQTGDFTLPIVLAILVVVAVVAALTVYFRKRKRN